MVFFLTVTILILLLLIARIAFLFWRKSKGESFSFSNSLNSFMLLLFLLIILIFVIYYSIQYNDKYLPEPASYHGEKIDFFFAVTLGITGFVFFVTQILLFYFPYRFRANRNKEAFHIKNNLKIEITWIAIPFSTFIFLFIWSQFYWEEIKSAPPSNAIEIEIMGEQFIWRVRYPGKDKKLGFFHFKNIDPVNEFGLDLSDTSNYDDFTTAQLHLPKGVPVSLRIRSRDVIHSVYLPHFRVKMDAVPGITTYFHFTPRFTTEEMRAKLSDPLFNYEMACAELCGRMHFAMHLPVVVEEKEEFDNWYNSQSSWLSNHQDYIQRLPDPIKKKVIESTKFSNQTIHAAKR